MWDLPGPGLEPVSPALAGRFLITAPPGKSVIGDLTAYARPGKDFIFQHPRQVDVAELLGS